MDNIASGNTRQTTGASRVKVERHNGFETVTFLIDEVTRFEVRHMGDRIEVFGVGGGGRFTVTPRSGNIVEIALMPSHPHRAARRPA